MTGKNNIKTSPATLNEWTLELQLTSELNNLFSNIWLERYPRLFRRRFRLPMFNPLNGFNRKPKATKLTPIEENKGGGWDMKITIPNGYFRDARALFFQIKRGYSKTGNDDINSIFSLDIKNPNPYIEFTFNSNKGNNQHHALQQLSENLIESGRTNDSVMYAFPRITQLEEFHKLEDSLLLHTTFLSIQEMDKEADNNNVDLGNGNDHFFRTDKNDESKREICSVPFQPEGYDISGDILFEICSLKLARIWNEIRIHENYFKEDYEFIQLVLADFLRLNPFNLEQFRHKETLRQTRLNKEALAYYMALEDNTAGSHAELGIDFERFKTRNTAIFNKISAFFYEYRYRDKEKISFDDIPQQYTMPLTYQGVNLKLDKVPENFAINSIIL